MVCCSLNCSVLAGLRTIISAERMTASTLQFWVEELWVELAVPALLSVAASPSAPTLLLWDSRTGCVAKIPFQKQSESSKSPEWQAENVRPVRRSYPLHLLSRFPVTPTIYLLSVLLLHCAVLHNFLLLSLFS